MSAEAPAQSHAASQFAERAVAIAHELNNILTVVRTYTHFARLGSTPEQRTRDLRVVAAAAERGAALTDWLGSAHESLVYAPDTVPSRELLSTVGLRLQLLLTPNSTLDISSGADDLFFLVNRSRLEHVINSLVLTANLALSGGAFTLAVERAQGFDSSEVNGGTGRAAIVICCHAPTDGGVDAEGGLVTDQLAGAVELLADLLSTMQGTLTMSRAKQGFARFEIELPLAAGPRSQRVGVSARPPQRTTVLVVEDDAAIRSAMRRTLTDAGHVVLEASDGQAAEEILAKVGLTLDLVVSDLVLPRGGAPELFALVKVNFPGAAFLMVSGREREGARKASELGAEFLGKPFYPAEFLAAARRTIAAARVAAARALKASGDPVVLIVDADADLRDSLARLLSECDFETHVAKSGPHAVQALGERRFDAVVTDQFIPGLDGSALLQYVYEQYPDCRRILCTRHALSDTVIGSANPGRAHRVLGKAMHAVALRDEIERAVLEGFETRAGTR